MVIMVMIVMVMMIIIMMLVVVVVVKPTYPSRLRSSHSSGSPSRLLSLETRKESVFSHRKLTAVDFVFFLALSKKRVSLCLLEKINFFCCHLRLFTPMPQYLSLDPCCGLQYHSACSIVGFPN